MKFFMSLLISGLVLGGTYGLIALGYSLIYKASGLMSFVQGDIMTLGAYLGLTFFSILKLPFIVSVLLTVLCAFLVGMLLERGVIRVLLNKNVLPIYVVLATIAISYIIQNGAQLTWGSLTLNFPSVFDIKKIKLFGVSVRPEQILCTVASLVIMVLLHLFMTKTRFGTSLRAAAMDPMAAQSCGINVHLSTGVTWGLSAGLAAIAGILVGPLYGVFILLGNQIGNKGFSGAVIGGYGNMYGAMVGGLLLGLIETFVTGYISSDYKNLIAYIILIVFLFVKPTGIFNERAIADE
ncbi:MAG: branched-chain amino acid ABC transporter permease [Clostridia bacterium]|nr:branched-chain amino acid ABC transporter permease [Clostridia bacterium]